MWKSRALPCPCALRRKDLAFPCGDAERASRRLNRATIDTQSAFDFAAFNV